MGIVAFLLMPHLYGLSHFERLCFAEKLGLEQVITGCWNILWCHQRYSSKLANKSWDRRHADHQALPCTTNPQTTEMINFTSCVERKY